MSTNKSQNLKLHLWEPEDHFLRTEFNENFAALDTAITAAQQTANSALTAKPYVVGSYTGTGKTMTFDIGFRPSFLIVSGPHIAYPSGVGTMAGYTLCTGGTVCGEAVTFTDTGFILKKMDNDNAYPQLVNIKQYNYIAFR